MERTEEQNRPKEERDVIARLTGPFRESDEEVEHPIQDEEYSEDENRFERSDIKKIKYLLTTISFSSEEEQKKAFGTLKKICQGLISEPEKYKELNKEDEEIKNNLLSITGPDKLLEILGYNVANEKFVIDDINKELLDATIKAIEDEET